MTTATLTSLHVANVTITTPWDTYRRSEFRLRDGRAVVLVNGAVVDELSGVTTAEQEGLVLTLEGSGGRWTVERAKGG